MSGKNPPPSPPPPKSPSARPPERLIKEGVNHPRSTVGTSAKKQESDQSPSPPPKVWPERQSERDVRGNVPTQQGNNVEILQH